MHHSKLGDPAIVGFARTARIAGLAAASDLNRLSATAECLIFGQRPYGRRYRGCRLSQLYCGMVREVNFAVHKGLGLNGAVTNRVMRDLDVLDEGFPILVGSIGPSHGYAHVVDIGAQVNILELRVAENELIHAVRHGALVIPYDVITKLKVAINSVIESEALVLGAAREPGFNIDKLEVAWAKFEVGRT